MAGHFHKLADAYLEYRPTYPSDWYSMLAALTPNHLKAWDVGTGNGQAAIGVTSLSLSLSGSTENSFRNVVKINQSDSDLPSTNWDGLGQVAEYYEQVIGTDISDAQLKHAIQHRNVSYHHTPHPTTADQELLSLLGGEGSVDLVTVAEAVHWFDLPSFYSLVTRLLRKPGGVLAVWGYNSITVSPSFDPVVQRFMDTTIPYRNSDTHYIYDSYRKLPFPFESVGLGSEGQPLQLDLPQEMSLNGFVGLLRSLGIVNRAKERGVDLLSEPVVREFESAWGDRSSVKNVTHKAFMLAGTPKLES